jgi:hypothetical protein
MQKLEQMTMAARENKRGEGQNIEGKERISAFLIAEIARHQYIQVEFPAAAGEEPGESCSTYARETSVHTVSYDR